MSRELRRRFVQVECQGIQEVTSHDGNRWTTPTQAPTDGVVEKPVLEYGNEGLHKVQCGYRNVAGGVAICMANLNPDIVPARGRVTPSNTGCKFRTVVDNGL